MSDPKIYDPTQDKDVPTPVRVNAVLYYMDKEPAIKEKLSSKTVGVKKRTGEINYFPLEVFNVAVKLHKDGKDALDIGKSEILLAAREILGLGPLVSNQPAKVVTASAAGATRHWRPAARHRDCGASDRNCGAPGCNSWRSRATRRPVPDHSGDGRPSARIGLRRAGDR